MDDFCGLDWGALIAEQEQRNAQRLTARCGRCCESTRIGHVGYGRARNRKKERVMGHSFNPVVGCTKQSIGCEACYALRMAVRLAHNPKLPDDVRERYASTVRKIGGKWEWSGKVALFPERLDGPLKRRKPTRYFVPSMGDLFHQDVPAGFIYDVFKMIGKTPQHTFQILTKRPHRMRDFVYAWSGGQIFANASFAKLHPNLWLGTSVENQTTADERVPWLLRTPAAVRFVSAEPLLGEIDIAGFLPPYHNAAELVRRNGRWGTCVACPRDKLGKVYPEECAFTERYDHNLKAGTWLDWIVCGTESGPGARSWDWSWIRGLRNQCQPARVPFFLKQVTVDGKKVPLPELDGRTWSEMPGQELQP